MIESESPFWLITGAASGIGAAVTQAICATDARVLALDVDDVRGARISAGTDALYQHCDVADPNDWHTVAQLLKGLGAPTHVHLNAGIQIAPPSAPLAEYQLEAVTLARYRKMMGVNVDGIVFGLQTLLPILKPGAAIVVTASLAGITPYSVDPLYAMSKHAVVGLVRSLGPTLAERGIRINAICPGGIDTAIIPDEQRTDNAVFMSAEHVAEEIIQLMEVKVTGKTWAKVSDSKPAFVVRAPGDRSQ